MSSFDNDDLVDFGFVDISPTQKTARVHDIFANVAPHYDKMNDAMSLGVHRVWKSTCITKMNPRPQEILLDIAGGTGDLARQFLTRTASYARRKGYGVSHGDPYAGAQAFIVDINESMLRAGLNKTRKRTLRGTPKMPLIYICANAETLPFKAGFADVASLAFGVRNITNKDKALRSIWQSLKPGGRFFCVEFSQPDASTAPQAWRSLYEMYSFNIIPSLGGIVASNREGYQYLVESIRRFPAPYLFAKQIENAGFVRVGKHSLSGGICHLYWGWKV